MWGFRWYLMQRCGLTNCLSWRLVKKMYIRHINDYIFMRINMGSTVLQV